MTTVASESVLCPAVNTLGGKCKNQVGISIADKGLSDVASP